LTPATSRPSRKILAVAIMVVVVAASLTAVLAFTDLKGQNVSTLPTTESSPSTSTSSSTSSGGTSTTYSTASDSGLDLQVMLNSSSIGSHGAVAAHIEVLNTLDHNVSLSVMPNQTITTWNGYDFFCSSNPSDSLVGFALFKGHFSAGNVSAAGSPLQLAAPVALPCPYNLPANGTTTFLPNSDRTTSSWYYAGALQPPYLVTAEVNATTGYCTASAMSGTCGPSSGLLGYWNPGFGSMGNMTLGSKDFTYFPPGEYTIVAQDDWSQTVYAHFQVTSSARSTSSSSNTVSTTSTQTVTYQCIITGQPGGLFLRILSDSDQTQVAGAAVNATNQPAYCNNSPANVQTTTSFTTTAGTQWYSLDSQNDAGYSFVVTYLGQTYTFQASLRPASLTCATLYVPSGRTNVTITEFQNSC